MTFILLSTELVEQIHDAILNPGEIPGRARDKSLEGALARVDNRLTYGMIEDAFDLAAAYAIAIAQGHCFNDGNKRTAHQSMDVCLDLNGVQITWSHEDVGQAIIRAAQRLMDEGELALWLRQRATKG
jgi:death-on-curing protein